MLTQRDTDFGRSIQQTYVLGTPCFAGEVAEAQMQQHMLQRPCCC